MTKAAVSWILSAQFPPGHIFRQGAHSFIRGKLSFSHERDWNEVTNGSSYNIWKTSRRQLHPLPESIWTTAWYHLLGRTHWAVRDERRDIKAPKRDKYWSEALSPKEHEAPWGRDAGTSPSPRPRRGGYEHGSGRRGAAPRGEAPRTPRKALRTPREAEVPPPNPGPAPGWRPRCGRRRPRAHAPTWRRPRPRNGATLGLGTLPDGVQPHLVARHGCGRARNGWSDEERRGSGTLPAVARDRRARLLHQRSPPPQRACAPRRGVCRELRVRRRVARGLWGRPAPQESFRLGLPAGPCRDERPRLIDPLSLRIVYTHWGRPQPSEFSSPSSRLHLAWGAPQPLISTPFHFPSNS